MANVKKRMVDPVNWGHIRWPMGQDRMGEGQEKIIEKLLIWSMGTFHQSAVRFKYIQLSSFSEVNLSF
jgi:hypothetical protein